MGSRALLLRCANRLVSCNKQCQYLSSSAALSKNLADVDKALQIHEPSRKNLDDVLVSKTAAEYEKELHGLITVESEVNAVGITSGVPDEHIKTRTVLIYKPAKNAMQSGTNNINFWQISFDTRERWENPLMGWCSSGDPLQATRVNFQTAEQAIEHCKHMGWKYVVQKENKSDPKPRSYGTNFSWDKRTRVTTK
ncbi:NADH dehydrogenase [ubiquinone] iron-sulfur protein 4, mitochondrial [Nasonia vitripennis]|uniref:NADH dehydrogenase [ubiquinone] iron-sulfur protein 4, mitochondrial n=1 Tax=Nasonia vitripennis TaxID=7425 RepID=A0A7M6UDI1_NASVI|nr:NADH dehydrogenase [ubiquinone] iron-sulfur protein 4, mitochondrial [Nasonia vitripennis]